MEIIGVLLLIASAVGALFLAIFFWAYRGEQFENIEAPARRMLFDPEETTPGRDASDEASTE